MSDARETTTGLTPLMRQYQAIKQQHPDKILFFRMGDFYEMFGDDAVKAAPILNITLTSRSHGGNERIPLAGVPYHAVDRYLARLLEKGEKVVVVEQVEDPRQAKGLVKREIVEILTPGTATVEGEGNGAAPRGLAAVCVRNEGRRLGMAALDLSTGAFLVDEGDRQHITERLRVLEPAEVIFPESLGTQAVRELVDVPSACVLTPFGDWNFDYKTADRELNEHFGTSTLDGFGVGGQRLAITAAGAVFRYLRENHRHRLAHIRRLTRIDDDEVMSLDAGTVRNLELVRSIATHTEENSLLGVIDHCRTAAGSRRLRHALLHPYKVRAPIERRLAAVDELVRDSVRREDIRACLKGLPDLEKLCGRLGIGRLTPRQAAAVRDSLVVARKVRGLLQECHSPHLIDCAGSMPQMDALIELLDTALVDDPPIAANKGGIFRRGYSQRLDELNDSIKDARLFIASLQEVERRRTGIGSLKVGYNKVFGYYLEVTKPNVHLVPKEYIRKQTLVNAERYITPELKQKEELIAAAEEKIFQLEQELYEELLARITEEIGDLMLTAELLAEVDLVAALAELATVRGYCRPEIFEDRRLVVTNGRHPVIEAVLPSGTFVANDVELDGEQQRMIILTGPNMSGKSTYLRQLGLIVILAQIGSFVPADAAQIGLVDRVFTRVGALDNLARGQSTFLVEMVETANILHNATPRSLILLDEVGRGTSTFDGLSVAWAVVEYINDVIKARTIFATHYHELTGMAALYPAIHNYQVSVKKWEDRVVFLHKIVPGGCDDSYGIEVAGLAGIPRAAIGRARQILRLLESGKFNQSELAKGVYRQKVQPTIFDPPPSPIEEELRTIDLENMTPMQAFELLRKLKEQLS